MDSTQSPSNNLFNMLSGFSAGHEKALKQGMYNALALFLLGAVSATAYGLYIVLNPFVKPLIWALLCGSVLFPFKCSLATTMQCWFDQTESSHSPLVINLILLPLQIVDEFSEMIGSFLWKNIKYIALAASLTASLLAVYCYTPNIILCLTWRIFMGISTVLNFFINICNSFMITTAVIGYLCIIHFYWSPKYTIHFHCASFAIWTIVSLYLSNLIGLYQVWIFITLQVLYLIGFIYEVLLNIEQQDLAGRHMNFADAVYFTLTNTLIYKSYEEDEEMSDKDKNIPDMQLQKTDLLGKESDAEETVKALPARPMPTASLAKISKKAMSLDTGESLGIYQLKSKPSNDPNSPSAILRDRYLLRKLRTEFRMSIDMSNDKVDTDKYMYGALYACIGMVLWKHKWIIHICVIPVAYYILKKTGCYFGFWNMIYGKYESVISIVKVWCKGRHQALLPVNVEGLYKIGMIADKKLTAFLKSSVDAVATTAVILGLLIFTICTSIFITIQVYAEGIHLIQVTGEILNSTVMNNPDIEWVPQHWEESINSVLDNAYTYGRSALSDGIKGFVKDLDSTKAQQLETKVLELWDRLYQAWMMSNEDPELIGPTVDVAAAYSVWESFKESYSKTPLQLFNGASIQNFVKENIGILMSVLDSLWSIVKGNMSIILSILSESFYVILMGGSAVLNFVLSMVVFFTALFYLLNSSNKSYKPIELTTLFSPISCHRYGKVITSCKVLGEILITACVCYSHLIYLLLSISHVERFATALQEAVIGVFAATFKLASFFGMWTWFIHNLFQMKLTYVPAVFATILGAVPILDAYFACIPAVIELWFTRGSISAILFFLFHFLPYNIVVTEFYMEIKGGGHPYLTGLSIAGGIFWLGVQGVIFGPLLLCCIMVIINLSRRYLQSPSVDVIGTYGRVEN